MRALVLLALLFHVKNVQALPAAGAAVLCLGPQAPMCALGVLLVSGATYFAVEKEMIHLQFSYHGSKEDWLQNAAEMVSEIKGMEIIDLDVEFDALEEKSTESSFHVKFVYQASAEPVNGNFDIHFFSIPVKESECLELKSKLVAEHPNTISYYLHHYRYLRLGQRIDVSTKIRFLRYRSRCVPVD